MREKDGLEKNPGPGKVGFHGPPPKGVVGIDALTYYYVCAMPAAGFTAYRVTLTGLLTMSSGANANTLDPAELSGYIYIWTS